MKYESSITNIPLAELTKRAQASGGISAKGMLLLIVYCIKLILVMPAALLQNLLYAKRIRNTEIAQPPIFILGHYRSGTTYLHKLLVADKRFGFITYYDILCPNSSLLFGKLQKNVLQFFIRLFRYKTSFFNNTIPQLDEPAEEERFLINKASAYTDYWKFLFPLCWSKWESVSQQCMNEKYYEAWAAEYKSVLQLAAYKSKGKQLVLKSPQNTERIKYLLKMFPDAKFIYISRNPYHVYYSMMNLWNRAIKKFCLQKITDGQVEEIIFSHYKNMMEQYEKDKHLIPAANLVEVLYEDLEKKPLAVLKKMYESLGISGFDKSKENINNQLQSEKYYHKFEYNYSEDIYKMIDKRWAAYIHKWNQSLSESEEYHFALN